MAINNEDEHVDCSHLGSLATGEPGVVHEEVQRPGCCIGQHVELHAGHGCQDSLHAVVEDVVHSAHKLRVKVKSEMQPLKT